MVKRTNKLKDQMLGVALMAGIYACVTLNRHMKGCEEASKNTKRALWVVLSAVIAELVIKGTSLIHFGG